MNGPIVITAVQRLGYELDARTLAFYRRNPCIAARELLGVELTDAQKYILQSTWNAVHSVWTCCRNFGKSFLGAVLMILKAILYPDQAIYIVGAVGDQAKETFSKIEELVTRSGKTAKSIESLTDIAQKEIVVNRSSATGFSHDPTGYSVTFFNGSSIETVNSIPKNVRSRRASLVFFDEAAQISEELITVCEAFATQDSNFQTSTKQGFDMTLNPRDVPTQLIYASSQDSMDSMFYKHYKEFAIKMLAGNRDYFVADMICDTAIEVYMNGQKYPPLLSREKVDTALAQSRDKALREYYNQPTKDGGVNQICKWSTVRRSEKFVMPQLQRTDHSKFVLAFDPARTNDNSITGVMRIYEDPYLGWCGDIVNVVNFVDLATKNKFKLDADRQLAGLQKLLLDYNGDAPDYEYIDSLLIDQGSGGGGTHYADHFMHDWSLPGFSAVHRGLIDANHELYETYVSQYPNACDKLRLISPRKYRTRMVEEFIELMDLGVIRFPKEFDSTKDYVRITNADGDHIEDRYLTEDERVALVEIDLMKEEITNIQKYTNADKTSATYALAKDKENTMHKHVVHVKPDLIDLEAQRWVTGRKRKRRERLSDLAQKWDATV